MTKSWEEAPGQLTPEETLDGFSNWLEIGRGGDATVYRALQDALGREVAIKVLMVDDEESVRRFTREVQLMVSLGRQHPNIAKVLQIGTSSWGRPCIVMDYYELGSLDKRLATAGPLSGDEAIHVGTVVADALSFAHGKGVLHRDVKPQNVLILPTSYVLADFGIARLIDSAHSADTDRFSYRHASPQVLDGFAPSESDDVFSLGATLFHLLDGRPPFTRSDDGADTALDYIKRVRENQRRQLDRPDLPPSLVAVIDQSLHPDPAERMATAEELRDLLAMVRPETRRWSQGHRTSPTVPGAPSLPLPPGVGMSATSAGTTSAPTGGHQQGAEGDSTVLRTPGAPGAPAGSTPVLGATGAQPLPQPPPQGFTQPPGVHGSHPFHPGSATPAGPPTGTFPAAQHSFTGPAPSAQSSFTGPAPVGADRSSFANPPGGPGYTAPPPLGHGFTAPPPAGLQQPGFEQTGPVPPGMPGPGAPTGSTPMGTGRRRWTPRTALVTGAVALVVFLVLVAVLLWQWTNHLEPAPPPATAGPTLAANPNLEPGKLQIHIEGDQATATWSKAVDSPDYWRWKAAGTPDQLAETAEQAGQTRRSATVTMDPSWKQVCFQVSGVTPTQRGDKQLCQAR